MSHAAEQLAVRMEGEVQQPSKASKPPARAVCNAPEHYRNVGSLMSQHSVIEGHAALQCETCEKWFSSMCLGLGGTDATQFVCAACQANGPSLAMW